MTLHRLGLLTAPAFVCSLVLVAAGGDGQRESTAEDVWIGKLVDADCKERDPEPPCPVGPRTTAFGMSVGGGYLVSFDEGGNELALELLRETGVGGNPEVRTVGERDGRTLKVEDLRLAPAQSP